MKVIYSSDTKRKNRIPPGQIETKKFPVLDKSGTPKIDIKYWKLIITGLVDKERVFNYDEFLKLPQVKVFSDIHCVTKWSKLSNVWEGVSSSEIKNIVKILPDAKFVIIYGMDDDFTTNLSLDDFFSEDVLFAVKHNDNKLTLEHGYPVRLVVPRLYFWKSTKWVTKVEFVKEDKPGYWETHGYHNHGDPWKEERYA